MKMIEENPELDELYDHQHPHRSKGIRVREGGVMHTFCVLNSEGLHDRRQVCQCR